MSAEISRTRDGAVAEMRCRSCDRMWPGEPAPKQWLHSHPCITARDRRTRPERHDPEVVQ